VRYTPAATLQWPYLRLHQFVYRHSGGLIGSRIVAGRNLLLTTTGRRSGEPRTRALIYLKDGERLVVVASNGGSDHPPSWLLNLQAHPGVGVQIGLNKFSAQASVASAEERERLWPRVNRHNMGLAPIMHPEVPPRHAGPIRRVPAAHQTRDSSRAAGTKHGRIVSADAPASRSNVICYSVSYTGRTPSCLLIPALSPVLLDPSSLDSAARR
jgi:F420H(2)-dependent quinone reductase